MLTEAEAKTKWCPFVRFSDEGPDLYSMTNRGEVNERLTEPGTLTRCIASACMAWRIVRPNPGDLTQLGQSPFGFCGAFGAPTPTGGGE